MLALGFDIQIPEGVYSPRGDTFLLVRNTPKGKRVLEIGCGSGLVSLAASRHADSVLGVDINPLAVECARANAKRNNIQNCEFQESDMFSKVHGVFDVILFNAPYLPKQDRFDESMEALAWCGGDTGREAVSGFINKSRGFLASNGTIAILISSITGLEQILDVLKENGFSSQIAGKEKVSFETLYCIHGKIRRTE